MFSLAPRAAQPASAPLALGCTMHRSDQRAARRLQCRAEFICHEEAGVTYTSGELETIAHQIVSGNRYMVVGTSSPTGAPWAVPVQFAVDGADGFYWVSALAAVHSKNISSNSAVSLVIFDSRAPEGTGQGLYCLASAEVLSGPDLEYGCKVFYARKYSDKSVRARLARRPDELIGNHPRRMYRATVREYSVLHQVKDPTYGEPVDLRVEVNFSTSRMINDRV
jgi:Pyridoxamine 5'-phosphate oxidase